MMTEQQLYTGPRRTITIDVEEKVIQDFRVAVSKKHRGMTKGMSFIEYNNALTIWTKVMNGEATIVENKTKAHPAIFGDK
jgi:hypothetical protein